MTSSGFTKRPDNVRFPRPHIFLTRRHFLIRQQLEPPAPKRRLWKTNWRSAFFQRRLPLMNNISTDEITGRVCFYYDETLGSSMSMLACAKALSRGRVKNGGFAVWYRAYQKAVVRHVRLRRTLKSGRAFNW